MNTSRRSTTASASTVVLDLCKWNETSGQSVTEDKATSSVQQMSRLLFRTLQVTLNKSLRYDLLSFRRLTSTIVDVPQR